MNNESRSCPRKRRFQVRGCSGPKAGEEEVIVKIGRVGICAADPKILHGTAYFSQTVYDHAPIVAGHEFVGEVVELGKGSKEKYGLKVGDKAIMEIIVPCRERYSANAVDITYATCMRLPEFPGRRRLGRVYEVSQRCDDLESTE